MKVGKLGEVLYESNNYKKIKAIVFIMALGMPLANTLYAQTREDFQTWGNITATGSLDFIGPKLKNFKY